MPSASSSAKRKGGNVSEEDNSPAWGRLSLVGRSGDGALEGSEHDDCGGEPASPEQEKLLNIMDSLVELSEGGAVLLLTTGGTVGDCALLEAPSDPSHEAKLAEAIQHLWLGAMVAGHSVEGYQQAAEVFLRKVPAELREAIRLEVCRG